ncbi:hypothetical protein [Azospirillum thermophilum]|uniref:Uncharacterized protein n=1 Tax=Azospirillum thermophilum TaxID=2202148 RepID=A0A2S2CSB8_9PROT|nr:hypothetical protein [Azospirillum thermophilum]AWK87382.1 hypothetical protein DEW08_15175 [Azospirillum thermophilum]
MYYSELSGPTGTVTTQTISLVGKEKAGKDKPAIEKSAADKQGADKTDAKAGGKSSASPAYTLSQSMESLLDSMTGQGGKAGAGGGAKEAGDHDGLRRAKEAQSLMQSALDQGKGGLPGALKDAIGNLKKGLGEVLSAFGMPDEAVGAVTGSFGDRLNSKLADLDFSSMALDMQSARSQWSIESHGIELTIADGDRKVQISFAKSTLDFRKEEQSLQASLGKGGDRLFGLSQSVTTASGKATGIIVRGNGFSEDEIKGILEKLNGMAAKGGPGAAGGMAGLAVLKPSTDKNGVTHLTLDLSVPVEGLSSGKPAAAATEAAAKTDGAAKPAPVNVVA